MRRGEAGGEDRKIVLCRRYIRIGDELSNEALARAAENVHGPVALDDRDLARAGAAVFIGRVKVGTTVLYHSNLGRGWGYSRS